MSVGGKSLDAPKQQVDHLGGALGNAFGGVDNAFESAAGAFVQSQEGVVDNYFRVIVLGPVSSGKSSLIKRFVCHRFDNLPTYNSNFMGVPADGVHVVRTTMPALPTPAGKREKPQTGADAPRDILLELQDRVAHFTDDDLINAPAWYERAPRRREPAAPLRAGPAVAQGSGRSDPSASERTLTTPPSSTERLAHEAAEAAAAEAEAEAAAKTGLRPGKVRTGLPPDREPHPLIQVNIKERAKEAAAQAARLGRSSADRAKANPIDDLHGAKGWVVAFDLCSKESFNEACPLVETAVGPA